MILANLSEMIARFTHRKKNLITRKQNAYKVVTVTPGERGKYLH
jgi:hypothetical protein